MIHEKLKKNLQENEIEKANGGGVFIEGMLKKEYEKEKCRKE